MFFITCDYDEGHPETYRAIKFYPRGQHKKSECLATGDPLHDYLTAMHIITLRAEAAGIDIDDVYIGGSSSIDHFSMDGGATLDGEGDTEAHKRAYLAAKEYERARLAAEGKTELDPGCKLLLDPMSIEVRVTQVAPGGAFRIQLFINGREARDLGLERDKEEAQDKAERFVAYLQGEDFSKEVGLEARSME